MIGVRLQFTIKRRGDNDDGDVILRKVTRYAEGPLVGDHICDVPILHSSPVFERFWTSDGWLLLDLGGYVPLPEQFDRTVAEFLARGWTTMGGEMGD